MEQLMLDKIKTEPDLKIEPEYDNIVKIEYDSFIKTEDVKQEIIKPECIYIKSEVSYEGEAEFSNDTSNDPFGDTVFIEPKRKRVRRRKFSENCPQCNIKFYVEDSYIKHILLHQGIDSLTCRFCLKVFENDSEHSNHMKNFHVNEVAVINPKIKLCSPTTVVESRVKCSEKAEKEEDDNEEKRSVWQCGECKMFVPSKNRNKHLLSHREYRCKICGMYFFMKDELIEHTGDMHNKNVGSLREAKCYICKEMFESEEELKVHLKSKHIFKIGKYKSK